MSLEPPYFPFDKPNCLLRKSPLSGVPVAGSAGVGPTGAAMNDQEFDAVPLIADELDLIAQAAGAGAKRTIELGCGPAALARRLVERFAGSTVAALEVDRVQHAKNLASPARGIEFIEAGAQSIPFAEASFDLAIMLKSLHHVPVALMPRAISEAARVLKPGGLFYVSEPVYGGAFNALIRLFNDEGTVRAAAQATLDHALADSAVWREHSVHRAGIAVSFRDFADFEARQMRPSYADHQLDAGMIARVREAFAPHCTADGAHFIRPLLIRILERRPGR